MKIETLNFIEDWCPTCQIAEGGHFWGCPDFEHSAEIFELASQIF